MTERALDAHRILLAATIVLILGAGVALLVYAADVFLMAFAGILIANVLRNPERVVERKNRNRAELVPRRRHSPPRRCNHAHDVADGAGLFGLLLASPLVAVSMVIVKMAYIEDVLGDRGESASA